MNNSLKDEHMDTLFRAVLKLETIEDCYRFFSDLCTISELKSISQRFEVALMLDEKHIYTDIASKTGASTATISRVNRCLNYGEGGYRMMLDRIKETCDE